MLLLLAACRSGSGTVPGSVPTVPVSDPDDAVVTSTFVESPPRVRINEVYVSNRAVFVDTVHAP